MSLVLVKIGDVYVLKDTRNYGNTEYLIDGEQSVKFGDIKRYQLDHIPKVETVTHKKVIDYYEKGDLKLTESEFNENVREMYNKHVDEDGDWDSIDAEFAYRKWREGWAAKYKELTVREEIEVPMVEQRKSEYKEIVPMYQIGMIEDPLCIYTPNRIEYIRDFAKELGLEEENVGYWGGTRGRKDLKLYNQTDSNGSGTYKMFIGDISLNIEEHQFKGTYDECVAKRESIIDSVHKSMQHAYDEQVATLTQDKAKAVLEDLRYIRSSLVGLKVYSKESSSKYFLLQRVDNAIDTIIKAGGEK